MRVLYCTSVVHVWCGVCSYPPKMEANVFKTAAEEAPKGMLARGSYAVHSRFTDDDQHDYLTWDWQLDIRKDWQ